MLLSIIIVNYNVKNLLRECLNSIQKASHSLDIEIWVVDNASSDQSVKMLNAEFPNIHVIENKENVGFAKANNQVLKKVSGEYILLLNPDTQVYESTLKNSIDFASKTPNCGGIGVKMIDYDGQFLNESKRGFPTPWVSFCRLVYLSRLFPKSALFNRYYMGHLDSDQCHKIDILAGAFILIKKDIIDEIGGLDEAYFMYGEDIDFSHRIQQAGYDNYYLGDIRILHHKGKSTNKNKSQYIEHFYGAMKIFAKKYYPKSYPIYALSISLIIYLKKMMLRISHLKLKN